MSAIRIGPPVGLVDVGAASAPTFADIDGDLDGFIGELNGGLLFFRNTGTARVPAFADPDTNPFGLIDVGSFSSPTFVDIDDDGDLDAFVGLLDGKALFFRNNGSATEPAFVPPLGLAFKEANGRAAFVDIDGDGDLDALLTGDGRSLYFQNRAPCPGDCNDSGLVAIDELIRGVNIALGDLELSACAAMDVGADAAVSIAELIAAVNAALSGCPR